MSAAPLIVTALLGGEDAAWLDGLRRMHFPPERNHLAAHLTMFHHLPPSAEAEAAALLANLSRAPPPTARASGWRNLGRGVALTVASPDLEHLRDRIADRFELVLTPQDRAAWRPHVTIQNKTDLVTARTLLAALSVGWQPRPLTIAGLGLWRYLGGPWEPIAGYRFRGG